MPNNKKLERRGRIGASVVCVFHSRISKFCQAKSCEVAPPHAGERHVDGGGASRVRGVPVAAGEFVGGGG